MKRWREHGQGEPPEKQTAKSWTILAGTAKQRDCCPLESATRRPATERPKWRALALLSDEQHQRTCPQSCKNQTQRSRIRPICSHCPDAVFFLYACSRRGIPTQELPQAGNGLRAAARAAPSTQA